MGKLIQLGAVLTKNKGVSVYAYAKFWKLNEIIDNILYYQMK